MAIDLQCPSCKKKLKTKDELAGKRVKCPGCGHAILAPAALEDDEQVPPAAADSSPPMPAEPGVSPLRWLLRLGISAFVAVVLGGIVFAVALTGLVQQSQYKLAPSPSGGEPKKTGNGTLRLYGIELLNSDDLDSFQAECDRMVTLVVGTISVLGVVFGGSVAFLALGRLTRRSRPAGKRKPTDLPSKPSKDRTAVSMRGRRRWLWYAAGSTLLVLAVGLAFFLWGTGISKAKYNKITRGMTITEVEAILGKGSPSEIRADMSKMEILKAPENSPSGTGASRERGVTSLWMQWGSGDKYILVWFMNGGAFAKQQEGL